MPDVTYSMIHLGKLADMDADERSFAAEGAAKTLANKSFGNPNNPLYDNQTHVTLHDNNSDGMVLVDNWSGRQEKISYALTKGHGQSQEIDSGVMVNNVTITVRLPDGKISNITSSVRIIQDTSGNVFMMPPPRSTASPSEIAAVTKYPIVGIKLPAATHFNTGYNAIYASRHDVAQFVPCFTAGTSILTAEGETLVEDLRVGDLVWTRDHGMQPIRWIGTRLLKPEELDQQPGLAPIRIRAGALGRGRPQRDLLVSPQHRMLVSSAIAQRMFPAREVLVAACQLRGVAGIETGKAGMPVTYVHLLFDRHEVLMSNGAERNRCSRAPRPWAPPWKRSSSCSPTSGTAPTAFRARVPSPTASAPASWPSVT